MAKRSERAEIRLVSDIRAAREPLPLDREAPLIIGVLGDFTGHPIRDKAGNPISLADRRPLEIDRDNFDAAMERLEVRFEASLRPISGQRGEALSATPVFPEIGSFHPDEVLKQIGPLRIFIELRRALLDPRKFDAAAAEVERWINPPPPAATKIPHSPPVKPSNILDAILAATDPSYTATPRTDRPGDLERFVREVVSPYLIRIDVRQQQQLIAAIDAALADQTRAILHLPEFQRLEAAWRALYLLVMNAETGPAHKIYLLNVRRAELEADFTSARAIEESGLFKNLSTFASEAGWPWGAFIGNYDFSTEDVSLLDRIAQLAYHFRAPFIAAASPRFFGTDSFTQLPSAKSLSTLFEGEAYAAWRHFRRSPQAQSVGLLLPRFLLRLPYGAQSDPIASFSFEEGVTGKDQDKYVWGNPAFAFAAILARAFTESGWSLDPARLAGQLDDMPLYTYEEGGMRHATPCGEVLLSDEVVASLEREGFMPLVSYRDRDFVALHRAQSVASPPATLAGRW